MFQTIRMLDGAKRVIVARYAYYIQDLQSTQLQNILIMHDLTEQFVMGVCHLTNGFY